MTNYDQLYSPPKAPPFHGEPEGYDVGDALVRAEFGGIGIRLLAQVIDQITVGVLGFTLGLVEGAARMAATGGTSEPVSLLASICSSAALRELSRFRAPA